MPLFRAHLKNHGAVYVSAADLADVTEVLRDHDVQHKVTKVESLEPFYEPVEVAGPLATREAHEAARGRHRDNLARRPRRCAKQGCGNAAIDGGVGCEDHQDELAEGFEVADELAAMGQLASAMGATVAAPISLRNAMRMRTMSAEEMMVPERADVSVHEFYASPAEIDRAMGSGVLVLAGDAAHMLSGDYVILWGRASALVAVFELAAYDGSSATIRLKVATAGRARGCQAPECTSFARWIGQSVSLGERGGQHIRTQGFLCDDHIEDGEPLKVTQVIDRPWPEVLPGRAHIATDTDDIQPTPEWRDA